jgi:hypothetical protein
MRFFDSENVGKGRYAIELLRSALDPTEQSIVTFSGGNAVWLEIISARRKISAHHKLGHPRIDREQIYSYRRTKNDADLLVLKRIVGQCDEQWKKLRRSLSC